MSKLLCLYNYNNYYNRIIKKFSTYNEYFAMAQSGSEPYLELTKANFSEEDGVYARHTINVAKTLPAYDKSPNYLVRESDTGELSRWFVLKATKTRGGQYVLDLRRDLVADFLDQVKTAPAFIQKATLPYDSPFIFNKETLNYNQIKQKEIQLCDETESGWIVGYYTKKFGDIETEHIVNNVVNVRTKSNNVPEDLEGVIDYNDLPADVKALIGSNGTCLEKDVLTLSVPNSILIDPLRVQINKYTISDSVITDSSLSHKIIGLNNHLGRYIQGLGVILENQLNLIGNHIEPDLVYTGVIEQNSYDNIAKESVDNFNNILFNKDGVIYRLKITKTNVNHIENKVIRSQYNDATGMPKYARNLRLRLQALRDTLDAPYFDQRAINDVTINADTELLTVSGDISIYSVTEEPVNVGQVGFDMNLNTVNQVYDSPYNMFAIPFSDTFKFGTNKTLPVGTVCSKQIGLSIARQIAQDMGSGCYDIQILPYLPFRKAINNHLAHARRRRPSIVRPIIQYRGYLFLDDAVVEGVDYDLIKKVEDDSLTTTVGIVYYPENTEGTFNIEVTDPLLKMGTDAIERKVLSETTFARFVSPNYSSSFDINPQKNDGISTINVDYNCKPFSPYIHVAPIFKGLYGNEFNDPKGLIVQGDFSITAVSDRWTEYEIQNKNYQNIFDRKIENLDVNNDIAMTQAKWSAAIGVATATLGGAASGMSTGASLGSMGGPYGLAGGAAAGAATGAIVGGIASAVGAFVDISLLKRSQAETRDFAVDMYTYQLENIQALPYTLSKVTAINANNKIFPIIEIYSCTEVEKQNLRDKIRYNGMTVMVQGKIEDYIVQGEERYIQAQLIRLENISEHSNVVAEINDELMKGVYING